MLKADRINLTDQFTFVERVRGRIASQARHCGGLGIEYVPFLHIITIPTLGTLTYSSIIGSDGKYLYCGQNTGAGNAAIKIDLSTGQVIARSVIIAGHGLGGGEGILTASALWVSSSSKRAVYKFSKEDLSILAIVCVGTTPNGMAFDGQNVWVTEKGSKAVAKIDEATNTVVARICVNTQPAALCYDGKYMWVTGMNSRYVNAIDCISNTVVLSINCNTGLPAFVWSNGNGRYIWIGNYASQGMVKYDYIAMVTVASISLASRPTTYVSCWDGRHLWVVSHSLNQVCKVDIDSMTICASITISSSIFDLCFDGQYVCVSTLVAGTTVNQGRIERYAVD